MKRRICKICQQSYLIKDFTNHLRSQQHFDFAIKNCDTSCITFQTIELAFKSRLSTLFLQNNDLTLTPEFF